jgi:hypothetical protein
LAAGRAAVADLVRPERQKAHKLGLPRPRLVPAGAFGVSPSRHRKVPLQANGSLA